MKRNRKTLKKTLSIMLSAVMLVSAMAFMPDNALEAEAATKNVTITKGSNMTKTTTSGAESQTGLTGPMTAVVYGPDQGYYFPYDYLNNITGIVVEVEVVGGERRVITVAINGICITRKGTYEITVSGEPTVTTAITLPNATAKLNQNAPTGVSGGIGKILGTTAWMQYASSADADDDSWIACSNGDTAVAAGTWYVRYMDTTLENASPSVSVIVTTAPVITTSSLPNGSVNKAYSETLAATGGGTMAWSISGSGSLPDGLSLGSDGVISGTPTTTGTFSFKVQASNGTQPDAEKNFSIQIKAEAASTYDVTVTKGNNMTKTAASGAESQTGLNGPMTNVVYTADSGYYFPDSYSVAGVTGIRVTRNSARQITVSGTPTETTAITLTDATAKAAQNAPTGLSDGIDKIAGTTAAMEYASSAGASSWNPCSNNNTTVAAGTWYVRYKETDTQKAGASASVTVTAAAVSAAPVITTNSLPNGSVNTAYNQTLAATGSGTITWSAISGSLPDGLSLGSDGVISGTPTTTGTFSFEVQASNGTQPDAAKNLSIVIDDGGSSGGPDTPAAEAETPKDKSARRDTKAYKEWAWSISKDNPDNYLEKIKDSSGKEMVSGVPTHTTSKDGSILIVSQKLEDAEKTFEKSDAKNQIVVKMNEIQCGLQMKKVFESNAAAQGAKLQSTYEIKAEERTKKEYQHVRDITSVTNPVTYTLLLPESMGDMAGKTVSILQYSDDGSTILLDDMDTDSKTITFVTKNPSGTFAVIVK